jgi:hypothetical protein
VLYRGINIDLNAVMRQKYDSYETAFAVGTKLTFPAPTACSTSDVVAGHFMNGIQLVIHKPAGAMSKDCLPNFVQAVRNYITRMVTCCQGLKVLVLDEETVRIVSVAFSRSELLKHK